MTATRKVSPAQQRVLDEIRSYVAENGIPPTRRELADRLGFSSDNAVQGHLNRLSRKGLIVVRPGSPRAIRVL